MKIFVVLVVLFSFCTAAKLQLEEESNSSESAEHNIPQVVSHSSEEEDEDGALYNFEWLVKDEDAKLDFGHQEKRNGDLTIGQYHVLLPDGVIQTVRYTINGNSGFVAHVNNGGAETKNEKGKWKPRRKTYEKKSSKHV